MKHTSCLFFICMFAFLLPLCSSSLLSCVTGSFSNACKIPLYQCFNNSDCSYQLHTNTQHIFIKQQDTSIPSMYFSNPLAIQLHKCLNTQCKIGQINATYPQGLPNDYCLMEVWDQCGGDIEVIWAGKAEASVMECYRKLCPKFKGDGRVQIIGGF